MNILSLIRPLVPKVFLSIIWLLIVVFSSLLLIANYSDYRDIALLGQARSFMTHKKVDILNFYERDNSCPTTAEIPIDSVEEKYLEYMRLYAIPNVSACYMIASLKNIDYVFSQKTTYLLLVMQPTISYKVSCNSTIKHYQIPCPN